MTEVDVGSLTIAASFTSRLSFFESGTLPKLAIVVLFDFVNGESKQYVTTTPRSIAVHWLNRRILTARGYVQECIV